MSSSTESAAICTMGELALGLQSMQLLHVAGVRAVNDQIKALVSRCSPGAMLPNLSQFLLKGDCRNDRQDMRA